jgi:hypothetical protein
MPDVRSSRQDRAGHGRRPRDAASRRLGAVRYGELQSLCQGCHSSRKQGIERSGVDRGPNFSCACDEMGWPLDWSHPTNVKLREEQAAKRRP